MKLAMRVVTGIYVVLAIAVTCGFASDPQKGPKRAPLPAQGIKTPGVRIPFVDLKTELEFEAPAPPVWIALADSILMPSKEGFARVDPKAKESKLGEPIGGLSQPCGGLVNAFSSLWVPNCGDGTVARLDPKTFKVTKKLATGTSSARVGIAATADSVWMLTDTRGTLSRIDPTENLVVAEFRVYADCNTLMFGETALWLTCPAESRVLRVDPQTNLVDKSIEVSAGPIALALGESSVWVLCEKEGKVERIDPKTNKVTKTIELGAPASGGAMAFGEGSLWISMPGFPITRIDPQTDKVVQQFYGEGGGFLLTTQNSVWLADAAASKLLRLDTRRIAATLAE
jgi:virginiamycin B lyase